MATILTPALIDFIAEQELLRDTHDALRDTGVEAFNAWYADEPVADVAASLIDYCGATTEKRAAA